VQPAIALAVRMFGYALQRLRRRMEPSSDNETTGYGTAAVVDGLCGDADDLTPLELGCLEGADEKGGEGSEDSSSPLPQSFGGRRYTLKRVYEKIVSSWSMTKAERQTLTLEYFHRLAAASARNGVGVVTQSPFQVYYKALQRATSGGGVGGCRQFGSKRHVETKRQVALALGSTSGEFCRGMDKVADSKVAVEVAALFPLTANANHSCRPNAEIRGGEFVDCCIDLLALRDIQVGEELNISYIALGRKTKYRRRRELAAKYLFDCNCVECASPSR